MYDTLTITVPKWAERNKSLKKHHEYFYVSKEFFGDDKVIRLTPGERLAYLWILRRCAVEMKSTVTLHTSEFKIASGLRQGQVRVAAKKLSEIGLINIEATRLSKNRIELNRKEKNRIEERGSAAPPPPPPLKEKSLHQLIEIWNANCGELPKVKSTNKHRDKKIAEVWPQQKPEEWPLTVQRLASSSFCNGKNDRGWKASFDFLIQPATWLKANEGKYDNSKTATSTAKTRTYDKLDELEQKYVKGGSSESGFI